MHDTKHLADKYPGWGAYHPAPPTMALNCLRSYDLSPEDVARMTDAELLRLRNFGPVSLAAVRASAPRAAQED